MIRTGVVGASGYAGAELVSILLNHPSLDLVRITSTQEAGQRIRDVYPGLIGRCDLAFVEPDVDDLANSCDVVFLAVPHTAAMKITPDLLKAGVTVIDLSADFRLADVAIYEQWYAPHTCPDLISSAVYSIPELDRTQIQDLSISPNPHIIANPGCYPTATTLAAAPLLDARLVRTDVPLIVDAISGVSGAGRGCNGRTHFCSAAASVSAYGVASHRHTPEIEQNLSRRAQCGINVVFTPHLAPLKRGLLSTVYLPLKPDVTESEASTAFERAYRDEIFAHVLEKGSQPQTSSVEGTNCAHIGYAYDGRTHTVIATCAIDNLLKGAAGQAIQNANILFGFDEDAGLRSITTVV